MISAMVKTTNAPTAAPLLISATNEHGDDETDHAHGKNADADVGLQPEITGCLGHRQHHLSPLPEKNAAAITAAMRIPIKIPLATPCPTRLPLSQSGRKHPHPSHSRD